MKYRKSIKKDQFIYIYGKHSVFAALKNTKREISTLYLSNKNSHLQSHVINIEKSLKKKINCKIITYEELDKLLGKKTKHQGLVFKAKKIDMFIYKDIFNIKENNFLSSVALDNLSDPQNMGYIQVAYLFNFNFILTSTHKSPVETNSLLNAASGTFESTDTFFTNNPISAIKILKTKGWWIIGLDHNAECDLNEFSNYIGKIKKVLIVLGSEGKGIRRLIKENCDTLVKINTTDQDLSLNVSSSAAIAFHYIYNNFKF